MANDLDRHTRRGNFFYKIQNEKRRKSHEKKNNHGNNRSNGFKLM
jgi:hypothetical protein